MKRLVLSLIVVIGGCGPWCAGRERTIDAALEPYVESIRFNGACPARLTPSARVEVGEKGLLRVDGAAVYYHSDGPTACSFSYSGHSAAMCGVCRRQVTPSPAERFDHWSCYY